MKALAHNRQVLPLASVCIGWLIMLKVHKDSSEGRANLRGTKYDMNISLTLLLRGLANLKN
jgi:hypothetical protein